MKIYTQNATDFLIELLDLNPDLAKSTIAEYGGLDKLIETYQDALNQSIKELEIIEYQRRDLLKSIEDGERLLDFLKNGIKLSSDE